MDLVFIVGGSAFFLVALAYAYLCDRL